MADSTSSESSSISGSDHSDFEASMGGEHNERVVNLLMKSGPGDLNRLDEPKIERKSQTRIKSPCAAAASTKQARMVSAYTLVNKISENWSLTKSRSDQIKKTKCAASRISWERSVFMLHTRTFRS